MSAQEGVVQDATDLAGDAAGGATDAAGDAATESLGFLEELKDSILDTDTGLVGQFISFIPKFVGFLVILIIGLFIAKLIGRGVRKVFKKINFDHYVDKSGLGAPLERAGFKDSGRFAGKVVYWLILLIVLQVAFETLGIKAIQEPFNKLIDLIPNIIGAMILVVIGGIVANTVQGLVGGATSGQAHGPMLTKVAVIAIWFIFGSLALTQLGIGKEFVDTLTTIFLSSLGAIIVIKFGVGGIWAARDRFWPGVYDSISPQSGQKARRPQAPDVR